MGVRLENFYVVFSKIYDVFDKVYDVFSKIYGAFTKNQRCANVSQFWFWITV